MNNLRYSVANIKLPDVSREELEAIRRDVWLHYKQNQTSKWQYTAVKKPFKEFRSTDEYEYAGFSEKRPNEFRSGSAPPATSPSP